MPFNVAAFQQAAFVARTKRVPVPALSSFFDEGEPPEWEVRGLTAAELQRAIDASRTKPPLETIMRAISNNEEAVAAIRAALGLTKDTPGETAKRIELLVAGSVAPSVDLQTAVKLAETFPIEFMLLTNAITELTGKGFDIAKPAAASPTTPD